MNYFKIIYLAAFLLSCNFFSQTTGSKTVGLTLPLVTIMDVEPAGTITMNFTAPSEAGRALTSPSANTTKWINYTSAIASGGSARRITASINQLLSGVDIKVQAASASGGGGILGTPSSIITLTTTSQTIISGIGGAYTGNGSNNGHRLTVTLSPSIYANITTATNTSIVITYTITE